MRSWKIPLIWINLTSRTMNDSFWTQCRHVQSTDLLWKDLLLGCKNVTIILEISWLMNYSPNSYRSNWSVSDFERRHVSDFLKKMIIYQIPIYHLYFIKNEYVKFLFSTSNMRAKILKYKTDFFWKMNIHKTMVFSVKLHLNPIWHWVWRFWPVWGGA